MPQITKHPKDRKNLLDRCCGEIFKTQTIKHQKAKKQISQTGAGVIIFEPTTTTKDVKKTKKYFCRFCFLAIEMFEYVPATWHSCQFDLCQMFLPSHAWVVAHGVILYKKLEHYWIGELMNV